MDYVLSSLPLPARLRPETPMSDEEFLRFSAENDSLRMERKTGLCLDFETLARAKQRARDLGCGLLIVRNFNLRHKDGNTDWFQDQRCWFFDGHRFRRVLPDQDSTKLALPIGQTYGEAKQILRQTD